MRPGPDGDGRARCRCQVAVLETGSAPRMNRSLTAAWQRDCPRGRAARVNPPHFEWVAPGEKRATQSGPASRAAQTTVSVPSVGTLAGASVTEYSCGESSETRRRDAKPGCEHPR